MSRNGPARRAIRGAEAVKKGAVEPHEDGDGLVRRGFLVIHEKY
jgi:hypothetical protein